MATRHPMASTTAGATATTGPAAAASTTRNGGVCWWCCMRVLEKCLPRNDIVRELAPYLQHVHRDDADEGLETLRGPHSLQQPTVPPFRCANGPNGDPASAAPSCSDPMAPNTTAVATAAVPTTTAPTSANVTMPTRPLNGTDALTMTAISTASTAASSTAPGGSVTRHRTGGNDEVRTPNACDFVPFEDHPRSSSESRRQAPVLLYSGSIDQPDAVDEIVRGSISDDGGRRSYIGGENVALDASGGPQPPIHPITTARQHHQQQQQPLTHHQSDRIMTARADDEISTHSAPGKLGDSGSHSHSHQHHHHYHHHGASSAPIQKKTSLPKIKTELGDISPVPWEKVVIVQVSVQGFREMATQAKDLMDEAKLLYEHTVLSRLATEYGGQEILSHSRYGLFVIAFASEFHAAKWCLSLQLSLLYAAWNDKLLKQFDHVREEYIRASGGRSRKNILLYRGFRVRMVIHTADPEIPPEKSLAEAVKWTNTVSNFAHGGQIVLSDSVWDRLKEQLVQLGNPVVEDLGCHLVLDEEVMLMLLLPRDLECRRFPTLKSPDQLSPGMRDAPSAQKPVTMVFTFIEGARPLVRCHAEELAERIKTLCMVARELLRKHNGYECQELQGDFMLAFFNPVCAVLWCTEFQLQIRDKFREWNSESENQELMFSMSMGIETGVPASVSPHKTSGRADYFGNIVNQTARIAKAAHGGQILIGGEAWNAFNSCPHRSTVVKGSEKLDRVAGSTVVMFKFHGYYAFKGITLPIALVEAIPVDAPITRGENIRILLAQTRVPKAKIVEDGGKKSTISPVPSDMLRLHHNAEREQDTIRETEIGVNFSWDDNIPIVEEHGSIDEDGECSSPMVSGSTALAMSKRLNHSGLLLMMRGSSSHTSLGSPKAAKTERMDRV